MTHPRPGLNWTLIVSLACATAATTAIPAQAQISSPFVPTSVSQEKGAKPRNNSIQLFPLARFSGKDDSTGDSASINGVILAGEAGYALSSGRSFKVGGFAFFKDDNSLFEVHGKYYLNSNWGAQLGLLKGDGQSDVDADLFILYNFAPKTATRLWSIQLGAGGYFINNADTVRATGFLQGSYEVAPRISIDASYWYINTPSGHFDRTVLGVGYRF